MDPCRCRQEPSSGHLRCHRRPFLVVTAFFCLATVPSSLGHPRWQLAELATQPRTLLTQPPCPRLSPPRRCRHPEFSSSLTSSLGSGHRFFCYTVSSRRRPVGVPGISSPPSCRIMGALLGEPLRSLRLYQAPPPLAYSFAPPLWDEPLTSTLPGLIGTSYPPFRCLDSSTSSTRPHTSSSLKDCCWRVG